LESGLIEHTTEILAGKKKKLISLADQTFEVGRFREKKI
jgi:hypothetical protein